MSRAQEARDRAAQWIIACEQPEWSDTDKAALATWLAESDMNKAAYWRLEHSWREADRIGALGRGTALSNAERPQYRGFNWWVPIATAASLVVAVGFGYSPLPRLFDASEAAAPQRFDTPIGGRRMLELPDGSRVELNTASAVRTVLDGDRREIWLDRGEAYFEVVHNKARPFVVHAGRRQVLVLGTKFSVRRDGEKMTVSVLEGRVQLDDLEDARAVRSTIIAGGDVAVVQGAATLVTGKSEELVEDSLAWREGMLSFDQERLGDVAAEFNRYNSKQIIVTDPAAANIRIGGMFPASKPDAFVGLLRDAYGLEAVETPNGVRISD